MLHPVSQKISQGGLLGPLGSFVVLCGPLKVLCGPLMYFVAPMVLWGLLWSFKGPLRSSVILCGPLWSFNVLCGPLWSFEGLCGLLRVLCGPLLSSVVLSGPRWSFAVHCGPLIVLCDPSGHLKSFLVLWNPSASAVPCRHRTVLITEFHWLYWITEVRLLCSSCPAWLKSVTSVYTILSSLVRCDGFIQSVF